MLKRGKKVYTKVEILPTPRDTVNNLPLFFSFFFFFFQGYNSTDLKTSIASLLLHVNFAPLYRYEIGMFLTANRQNVLDSCPFTHSKFVTTEQ